MNEPTIQLEKAPFSEAPFDANAEDFTNTVIPENFPNGMTSETWLSFYSSAVLALNKITEEGNPKVRKHLRGLLDQDAREHPEQLLDILSSMRNEDGSPKVPTKRIKSEFFDQDEGTNASSHDDGEDTGFPEEVFLSSAIDETTCTEAEVADDSAEPKILSRFINAIKPYVQVDREFGAGPPEPVSPTKMELQSRAINALPVGLRVLELTGVTRLTETDQQQIDLLRKDMDKRRGKQEVEV